MITHKHKLSFRRRSISTKPTQPKLMRRIQSMMRRRGMTEKKRKEGAAAYYLALTTFEQGYQHGFDTVVAATATDTSTPC
jgi:hypothetical protein